MYGLLTYHACHKCVSTSTVEVHLSLHSLSYNELLRLFNCFPVCMEEADTGLLLWLLAQSGTHICSELLLASAANVNRGHACLL